MSSSWAGDPAETCHCKFFLWSVRQVRRCNRIVTDLLDLVRGREPARSQVELSTLFAPLVFGRHGGAMVRLRLPPKAPSGDEGS